MDVLIKRAADSCYSCPRCTKTYSRLSHVTMHFLCNHIGGNRVFQCNLCHKISSYYYHIDNHTRVKHYESCRDGINKKGCRCSLCLEPIVDEGMMLKHIVKCHPDIIDGDNTAKLFLCSKTCGRAYFSLKALMCHRRTCCKENCQESISRTFLCAKCKQIFYIADQDQFIQHILKYHVEAIQPEEFQDTTVPRGSIKQIIRPKKAVTSKEILVLGDLDLDQFDKAIPKEKANVELKCHVCNAIFDDVNVIWQHHILMHE